MVTQLELRQLSTGYIQKGTKRYISHALSACIATGEFVALMGANGSGKSTLLHTLAGLLPALGGQSYIMGQDSLSLNLEQRAKLLSLVLTERVSDHRLKVEDVILIGRYPYMGFRARVGTKDRQVVAEAICLCGLEGMERRLLCELSDGERQRVMIARALAQETPLIFLDEPTAHLDLSARIEMMQMLRHLARYLGKSILISTHELDLALSWADTIWLLDKSGQMTCAAPEDHILRGTIASAFINEYLHFDSLSAQFIPLEEEGEALSISGQGLAYHWTCRAVQRLGYRLSLQQEALHIEVKPTTWLISYHGKESLHTNLTSLSSALRQIKAMPKV